ncbi:hypothetical protein CW362_34695 [Streptomyces populi]|uniref:Uncharacterized protein n=1 Tax=Streptomyces populi TaxID=2058924 RepID=A0A2I0SEY4_9ACTN|nr:hypothetical protein CW362_34695 [Streptomyces populi]
MPGRTAAGPPGRRAAGPPGRRAAGLPGCRGRNGAVARCEPSTAVRGAGPKRPSAVLLRHRRSTADGPQAARGSGNPL